MMAQEHIVREAKEKEIKKEVKEVRGFKTGKRAIQSQWDRAIARAARESVLARSRSSHLRG